MSTTTFSTADRWMAAVIECENSADGNLQRLALELRSRLLVEMTERDSLRQQVQALLAERSATA